MHQGGLGLPDRDYYVSDDARSKEIRGEYQKHLVNTFKLLGYAEADAVKNAATVVKIETELAKASSTRLALRDPVANYAGRRLEAETGNGADLANLRAAGRLRRHAVFRALGDGPIGPSVV